MTFQPLRPNWLSPGFDQIIAGEPELMKYYESPDYSSEMSGEGDWVDLFVSDNFTSLVGRLWVSPENNSIGIEELEGSDTDHLTRVALQLRELHAEGVEPLNAWLFVMNEYPSQGMAYGDLKDAKVAT